MEKFDYLCEDTHGLQRLNGITILKQSWHGGALARKLRFNVDIQLRRIVELTLNLARKREES